MSGSNCCFLACIQVSLEEVKMLWYSYLFKNFPQFGVIYTAESFSIVSTAEVDVFLEFSCFLMIQQMLAIWSLVPLPGLNPACISGSSWFTQLASMWYVYSCEMRWHLVLVAQLCLTVCSPMDCSPPGSSVHGIFQARILEWVAISFSRGSPNQGIEPRSPALQVDSLPTELQGKPL